MKYIYTEFSERTALHGVNLLFGYVIMLIHVVTLCG